MKFFNSVFFLGVFFIFSSINAQKIGVVDTEYILNKIPEYKDAETRLNTQISTWQTNLQSLEAEYKRKKTAFENEKYFKIPRKL